jgi:guanine nucleotide-binding protein G(i) subunit alpha
VQNITRIGADDYKPSDNDVLRARLRTSGIVEKKYKVNESTLTCVRVPAQGSATKADAAARPRRFIDVGGQRNERRKWVHCFENVTCVIFVAAISEYDQSGSCWRFAGLFDSAHPRAALFEDEKMNRLEEALSVFDSVVNNQVFAKTDMCATLAASALVAS